MSYTSIEEITAMHTQASRSFTMASHLALAAAMVSVITMTASHTIAVCALVLSLALFAIAFALIVRGELLAVAARRARAQANGDRSL